MITLMAAVGGLILGAGLTMLGFALAWSLGRDARHLPLGFPIPEARRKEVK